MKSYRKELWFNVPGRRAFLNITPQVDQLGFDFSSGFQNEINHFIDSCLGRKETLSPVEDGLEVMKMLCGIYESAEKGQEIHFS